MSTNIFDIIIIGGGISGLGVAREASRSGRRVLLLERGVCGAGTSQGSLRIMHGGFRYLQQLNFKRVLESIRAQQELKEAFPEWVKPLPCVMPLARSGLKSRWPVSMALVLFGFLSRCCGASAAVGKVLSTAEVENELPLISGQAPHGALLWWDALLVDHQKLIRQLMTEVMTRAGTVEENCRVTAVVRSDGQYQVSAQREGGEFQFLAPVVVNTAGAWIDSVRPAGAFDNLTPVYWCKAFNVLISRKLTAMHGVGVHSAEGRLYFTVPRGQGSALGTAYLPLGGDPDSAAVTEVELCGFIESFNRAFPQARVQRSEVLCTEQGVLPTTTPDPLSLKGSAEIRSSGGYVEVLSTKYTTFLTQARRVLGGVSH